MDNFKIIEEDGCSFDIEASEDYVSLAYDESNHWTPQVRGTKAIELIDDGNGILIKLPNRKGKLYLDYCQASYIFQALRIKNRASKTFCNYKFYKEIVE